VKWTSLPDPYWQEQHEIEHLKEFKDFIATKPGRHITKSKSNKDTNQEPPRRSKRISKDKQSK